jgi:hypothetical protein
MMRWKGAPLNPTDLPSFRNSPVQNCLAAPRRDERARWWWAVVRGARLKFSADFGTSSAKSCATRRARDWAHWAARGARARAHLHLNAARVVPTDGYVHEHDRVAIRQTRHRPDARHLAARAR